MDVKLNTLKADMMTSIEYLLYNEEQGDKGEIPLRRADEEFLTLRAYHPDATRLLEDICDGLAGNYSQIQRWLPVAQIYVRLSNLVLSKNLDSDELEVELQVLYDALEEA